MPEITPLFRSHYSIPESSLLTLDEPGKAKPGAALSVFDLARAAGLTEVTLVDSRIDGVLQAFKSSLKAGVKLTYGIRFVVCSDLSDKTPQSRASESKLVVICRDPEGYSDLVRLWSRAWTTGHFTYRDEAYGRLDWPTLKALWTPHLMTALPFFSSFLAINTLTFNRVVPDFSFLPAGPSTPPLILFREVGSQLPFAPLIDDAVTRYAREEAALGPVSVIPSKTILYPRRSDLKAYVVKRCVQNRSTWDSPEVAHLSSAEFCYQAWAELTGAPQLTGSPDSGIIKTTTP